MDLREYLFRNNLTITTFAKKLGVHPGYLSQVKRGKKPGKYLSIKIEELTKGQVTFEDLRNEKRD